MWRAWVNADSRVGRSKSQKKLREEQPDGNHKKLLVYGTVAEHFYSVSAKPIRDALKVGISELVAKQEDYWQRWTPAAWANADPETAAHLAKLELWTVPRRDVPLPDLTTYLLGKLHTLDPAVEERLRQLVDIDLSRYVGKACQLSADGLQLHQERLWDWQDAAPL